jgi:hypothetical protein
MILVLVATVAFGQNKIATVKLENNVAFASVDRPGDLYVVLVDGKVVKLDKSGTIINTKQFRSVPTLFDPRDGTRAFAYFRDTQTIESIAPDLSFADPAPLHPEFAVSAWLVCPSKNDFWILDGADLSLKKTKDKGTAIAYETAFGESNVQYMREYLNFLFVLHDGIHILNNLGKEIFFLESNPSYFNFLGEELYFPLADGLQMIDLYTTNTRQIKLPHPAKFALLTDERMILIDNKTVEFFEFKP